jgi:hypothetical protein
MALHYPQVGSRTTANFGIVTTFTQNNSRIRYFYMTFTSMVAIVALANGR